MPRPILTTAFIRHVSTRSVAAGLIAGGIVLLMRLPATFGAPAQTVDVAMRDNQFVPQTITVTMGTTVRWTNRGIALHTSTSTGRWESGAVPPGGTADVPFAAPGVYDYVCRYHQAVGMTGRVVVIDAAAGTATPGGTALPAPDSIVFGDNSFAGSSRDLYSIRPDGSDRLALTLTTGQRESQPGWAPGKQAVAYTAERYPDVWSIHVRDLATGAVRVLTSGPRDYEPDWSPDGAWIAYSRQVVEGSSIVGTAIALAAVDGSGGRALVYLDGTSPSVISPAWSPDGTRLAFVEGTNEAGGELFVMNADGTDAHPLWAHPGWDDIDPAWSPNGRYLAFASGQWRGANGARHDIWVLDLVTGAVGTVATHATHDLRRPSWSPDGARLVLDEDTGQTGPLRFVLRVAAVFGGPTLAQLTLGAEPDWSTGPLIPLPSATPRPSATATATLGPGTLEPPTPMLPSPTATGLLLPTLPPSGPTAPGPAPTFPIPTALPPVDTVTPTATDGTTEFPTPPTRHTDPPGTATTTATYTPAPSGHSVYLPFAYKTIRR